MASCEIPIAVKTCTGKTGPANSLEVGDVQTLPPGSEAEVSITGDPPNQVINFGIPEGETGASGGSDQDTAGWINDPNSLTRDALDNWLELPQLDRLYVSAKDFGVVGDGITDDHDAMTAAIAAAVGARLVLDAGPVVLISRPLLLPSNTHIDFGGRTLLRGYNTSDDGTPLLQFRQIENVVLENGTIDGNGDLFPNETSGYNLTQSIGVENITYRRMTFKHVIDNHAIDLRDSRRVRIIDCQFYGFKNNPGQRSFSEAIQIDAQHVVAGTSAENRDWLIQGCTFGPDPDDPTWGPWGGGVGNHSHSEGTVSHHIRIVDNEFIGCTHTGVRLYAMSDVSVSGNTFQNCNVGVRTEPSPAYDPFDDRAMCQRIVISDNTFDDAEGSSGVAILLNWAQNFTVTGNAIRGGNFGFQLRFSRGGTISGNSIRGANIGLLNNQTGWPDYAGQGYASDFSIVGNQIERCGTVGLHISSEPRRILIANNILTGGSRSTPSAAIRIGGAQGAHVVGNYNAQGDSPNQDTYGLEVYSGSTGVTAEANNFSGSSGPTTGV